MNIRVNLNSPITDGREVVFRSPVDCSQITGLIVYYGDTYQEFALADAHGNNVGDIDHLFAENVVVKVILDVTHGMAFVQNADTNAYLEGRFDSKAEIDDAHIGTDAWSSKNIIDRLCPPINETGLLVQCEAVEGYPLEVQAQESGEEPGVTVTVCGKNLYDAQKYPFTNGYYINKGNGDANGSGTHTSYCATLGYIPVSHLRGLTITLNNLPGGSAPGMAFYDANKVRTDPSLNGKGNNQIVPENAVYMRFCTYIEQKDTAQIEIGSTATDYEEYSASIFTAEGDVVGDFIPVPGVVARPGLTTIFAYIGLPEEEISTVTATEVKVSGKADPTAEIRRLNDNVAELKAAILTMGANV